MRKALLLLSALVLLAAVPSVADAQRSKAKRSAAPPASTEPSRNFIVDGFGQIFVPFQSVAATTTTAAPAKAAPARKARKSKRATKSKARAKKR